MARTNTNTQNDTKHVQHHDATDILKNYIFVSHFEFKCSTFLTQKGIWHL